MSPEAGARIDGGSEVTPVIRIDHVVYLRNGLIEFIQLNALCRKGNCVRMVDRRAAYNLDSVNTELHRLLGDDTFKARESLPVLIINSVVLAFSVEKRVCGALVFKRTAACINLVDTEISRQAFCRKSAHDVTREEYKADPVFRRLFQSHRKNRAKITVYRGYAIRVHKHRVADLFKERGIMVYYAVIAEILGCGDENVRLVKSFSLYIYAPCRIVTAIRHGGKSVAYVSAERLRLFHIGNDEYHSRAGEKSGIGIRNEIFAVFRIE